MGHDGVRIMAIFRSMLARHFACRFFTFEVSDPCYSSNRPAVSLYPVPVRTRTNVISSNWVQSLLQHITPSSYRTPAHQISGIYSYKVGAHIPSTDAPDFDRPAASLSMVAHDCRCSDTSRCMHRTFWLLNYRQRRTGTMTRHVRTAYRERWICGARCEILSWCTGRICRNIPHRPSSFSWAVPITYSTCSHIR
jgi:hypothetical protein